MAEHPELAEEQAYLDRAYECLTSSRDQVNKLRGHVESGAGGTFQARFERDVIEETVRVRLADLELSDHALIFGRIDCVVTDGHEPLPSNSVSTPDGTAVLEAFHIGRLAVANEAHEPVVVDWRAPIAEPFYRATGRTPMGLARRRHFAVKARRLVDMEDELFGDGHLGVAGEGDLSSVNTSSIAGYSTLLTALEQSRSGQLGDIVATIQSEQDEIIRSSAAGVLVVQGGPGTGKTVVALHRAAYLLYTHRFPLEDQGVLVIGPNRVFLRYIERVLPSLGEAGVELAVLADLVPDVRVASLDTGLVARTKGDVRMAALLTKAARDRERPLAKDATFALGTQFLKLRVHESERIVQHARRRFRRHNAARRFVEGEVFAALAATARSEVSIESVREALRGTDEMREVLERMWPVLSPAQLLHDLFGSRALLKLAAAGKFSDEEIDALVRKRSATVADVVWTDADVALLDEARAVLGPPPKPLKSSRQQARTQQHSALDEEDEIRTYGHIVIDEAQDLTPMQLRMTERRSLSGSMTIVGDLAQATGAFAPNDWSDVLAHLPDRRPSRQVELSIGYRTPSQVMEIANHVLRVAAPQLRPPRAVRTGDHAPTFTHVSGEVTDGVANAVRAEQARLGEGSVAVICPTSLIEDVADALTLAGVEYTRASQRGLDGAVSLVPVSIAKGLELDGSVVVEPAAIEREHGVRALYVALTRSTRALTVLHSDPLPACMSA
jgi:DNA helicase IV